MDINEAFANVSPKAILFELLYLFIQKEMGRCSEFLAFSNVKGRKEGTFRNTERMNKAPGKKVAWSGRKGKVNSEVIQD